MNRFTVEETNLMSIYSEGGKREVMENINAAMPYMDGDMRELARRCEFGYTADFPTMTM